MKILLAADGSRYTRAAARYLRELAGDCPAVEAIHVLHVQPDLPYEGRARAALGNAAVDRYAKEEADVALAVAERELRHCPVSTVYGWIGGDIAGRIAEYVSTRGIDLVVMGSHGHGVLGGALLGSVTQKCLRELDVPVLVVPIAAAESRVPDGKAAASA